MQAFVFQRGEVLSDRNGGHVEALRKIVDVKRVFLIQQFKDR